MFHRWGFLLGEIWVLLALAALVGLLAGWIIWGRRKVVVNTGEADRLRADLAACNAKGGDLNAKLAAAEARAKAAEAQVAAAKAAAAEAAAKAKAAADKASADAAAKVAAAAAQAAAPAPLAAQAAPVAAQAAAFVAPAEADKPKGLTAARGGKPDDLKLVKGIGPKLEILCNKLGFYHFDQIANWTAKEIAWVDENLEGFKGRVTRDEWVVQARDLAAGKPPRPGGEH
jgi:predicted flap endonuclease-1-like 5' DNA nuclease